MRLDSNIKKMPKIEGKKNHIKFLKKLIKILS